MWEPRLASTEPGDHLLVAEADGEVRGYAYSSSYRPKARLPAHPRDHGLPRRRARRVSGLGRRMYDDLLDRLGADGCTWRSPASPCPTRPASPLHRACGFEQVGVMREVGRKFDRWIDVLWLQKALGPA